MSVSYADIAAYQALTQRASAAAQDAYNRSMAANEGEANALNRAKFEWQKTLDTANQTGMWNGAYNMPTQQYFANTFGTWDPNGPQAGQQTLQAQGQYFNQGQDLSGMYGQYYAPGTAPTQGQQTLAAINQGVNNAATIAGLTGYYQAPGTTGPGVQTLAGNQQQFSQGLQTEQEARAAQAQQQSQAMSYLNLLSSLRGPADWAKYQQVLGSTPGGMRDLVAAAMGQYVPGGGATTGVQPQAVSLQSMMGDVSGQPYYGQGYGQLNMPDVYGQNTQGMYGQQPQLQTMQYYPQQYRQQYGGMGGQGGGGQMSTDQYQGGPAWGSGIGIGAQQPTAAQQQQAQGGGTNMYGNLPAPNQVSNQGWNNMAPSQQQMLYGMWESQGYDKSDAEALRAQSLPKYAQNSATAGTWRLQ